jgi:hypothetical protein
MFRAVFWVILPCKMIVDNHFTRQYNPEDSSEQGYLLLNPVGRIFTTRLSRVKVTVMTTFYYYDCTYYQLQKGLTDFIFSENFTV